MLLLVLSSKRLNFIRFLLFVHLFTGSKFMKESSTKFALSHEKLFTLVIDLHIFILFLVLNAIVLHARLLRSHLINRPSNNSHLKITNRPRTFHHTAPALWNSLPPADLRHFSSHSTSPQPNYLNSPLFFLSP
jgi:hypothetical protein